MDVDDDLLLNNLGQLSLIDTEPLSTTLLIDHADDLDDLDDLDDTDVVDDQMAYDGGSEPDDSLNDDSDSSYDDYDGRLVDADDLEMYFEMEYPG